VRQENFQCFECQRCGTRIYIAPDTHDRITCGECRLIYEIDEIRQIYEPWRNVTELRPRKPKSLEEALEWIGTALESSIVNCNDLIYYRGVVRFRQAIFDLYERDRITPIKAVALFASFQPYGEKRFAKVAKLISKSEDFSDFLGVFQKEYGQERPRKSDKFVILLDALVLSSCSNGYLHLLRDALALRAKEYSIEGSSHTAHRMRWDQFQTVKSEVETDCARIWQMIGSKKPDKLSGGWWHRVAYQQGLILRPSN
jgi:ribosomal protein S27AE